MQQKILPTALVEGAVPATRKVVTRSPGHTVRSINLSHLQPTAIEADSSLERDFIYVALGFPLLKEITHQPFKLKLDAGFYTPDFFVRFKVSIRVKSAKCSHRKTTRRSHIKTTTQSHFKSTIHLHPKSRIMSERP